MAGGGAVVDYGEHEPKNDMTRRKRKLTPLLERLAAIHALSLYLSQIYLSLVFFSISLSVFEAYLSLPLWFLF